MNADPRRPEKVQRYVPKASNGTGTEDLTPDYMNILGGQEASADKYPEGVVPSGVEPNHPHPHHHHLPRDEPPPQQRSEKEPDVVVVVTTASPGVVPTSPQYGVAIIPGDAEPTTAATQPQQPAVAVATPEGNDVVVATAKPPEESKEMHTTPNRNDRFKVVKIASLEPFKRGRWKCMDYLDEAPPAGTIRVPQSTGGGIQLGGPYMQTQSLPQQQIQQMLLQGGFTNGTQFFATGVPTQVLPQGQFFYPSAAQAQSMPQQQQQQVPTGQFITTGQPAYFPVQNAAGFAVQQSFPNTVQYVPANLIPNQNSAFVPTSQTVQMPPSFQQSQTYAGQANVLQQQQQQQPVVNGHGFTPDQIPTKNVINNSSQPVVSQPQVLSQQQSMQLQGAQSVPVIQNQQQQQQQFQQNYQQQQQIQQQPIVAAVQLQQQQQQQPVQQLQTQQSVDQSNNNGTANGTNNVVYTNPTFAMSVNSLTVLEGGEVVPVSSDPSSSSEQVEQGGENPDDPAKTNPVVNAIDNKIEQAMDLVKSHLMYTVREEVEVLKEKIAELMERIQQLETENNFLRSQIPKSQQQMPPSVAATTTVAAATAAASPAAATATVPQTMAAAAATAAAATPAAVVATEAMKPPPQQQQQ